MRVDNFVLLDHKGDAHDLYYHKRIRHCLWFRATAAHQAMR